MKKDKFISFSIDEWICLSILLISILGRTFLPGLIINVFIFQILALTIFIIYKLDFSRLLTFKLGKFDYYPISILIIINIIFFLINIYYINFSLNSDLKSQIKILSYVIIFLFFFFILPLKFFLYQSKFNFFINLILVIGIVSVFFGILNLILGFHPIDAYKNSSTGIYLHPNTASIIYSILIPIILFKYFRSTENKILFLFLLIMSLICLLYTYSRSGYLASTFAILIYTFLKSKKLFFFILILFILIGFSIVLDFATSKTDSSIARLLLIFTAYDMITSHNHAFLWGYGVYNSIEIFKTEKIFMGSQEIVDDPHNIFLLLGIQYGMIMVVLTFIITSMILIKALKRIIKMKQDSEYYDFSILSLTICFGQILQNLLEDQIAYPEYFAMPIFLIFLGYLFFIGKKIKPSY